MKITAIEFTEEEVNEIVNYITSKFNTEDAKQTIEFDLYDCLSCAEYESFTPFIIESVLELYTEMSEFDENHQTGILSRSVLKNRTTFFYDGEEIKVNSKNLDTIYEKINAYYEI
jgi:hypothetical protein